MNCGPEEWDKVRVFMEDGETVVEPENTADPKEDNSDNEDKDWNLRDYVSEGSKGKEETGKNDDWDGA